MRLRLVLGCLALALAFGPAAAAQEFPDLPGMSSAERAMGDSDLPEAAAPDEAAEAESEPAAPRETTRSEVRAEPAEEPAASDVDPVSLETITSMPGAGVLPVLENLEATEAGGTSASTAPLILLALAVVVLCALAYRVVVGSPFGLILRGIKAGEIFGPTDVYTVSIPLPGDSQPVVLGQVVAGMKFDSPPVVGKKNEPMMPVAWTKTYEAEGGKKGRVFTTTMGAATDFLAEGTRRMVINAVYWALGMEDKIPAEGTKVVTADFAKGDQTLLWRVISAGDGWSYVENVKTGLVTAANGKGNGR